MIMKLVGMSEDESSWLICDSRGETHCHLLAGQQLDGARPTGGGGGTPWYRLPSVHVAPLVVMAALLSRPRPHV